MARPFSLPRPLLLVLAAGGVACLTSPAGGADDGSTDDANDAAHEQCGVSVTTFPAANAVDAYYRGNIEFRLTKGDPTAEIQTDIPGTKRVSVDGLTVYWEPDSPLEPDTAYSATLSYCAGEVELTFSTSALGSPIVNAAALSGRSYLLRVEQTRVVEPPGAGQMLASDIASVFLLVQVTSATATDLSMFAAPVLAGFDDRQDYCDPSIPFRVSDFSGSPHFTVSGHGQYQIGLSGGGTLPIQNVSLSGDFSPDGVYFGGAVLQGTIDTRAALTNPGELCKNAATLGVQCQACDDGEPYCLNLRADSITATEATAEVLEIEGDNCAGCLEGVPPDTSAACDTEPMAE